MNRHAFRICWRYIRLTACWLTVCWLAATVASADVALTITDVMLTDTGGQFSIFADPDGDRALPTGAYSINLQFSNFTPDFTALDFDLSNRLPNMNIAGATFGTTPFPGTLMDGDVITFVAFGPGELPIDGDYLMDVDFSVPGGFLEGGGFDVEIVPIGDNPLAETFVQGEALTLDATRIVAGSVVLEPCDVDRSGLCDAADIDFLSDRVREGSMDLAYDLDQDGLVSDADRSYWVNPLANSYFGDANLDGEFNSTDLIAVFVAGEFEDTVAGNSTWATGDWNGDREFTSSDIIRAFQDGGYEQGPRAATAAAVPEPCAMALFLVAICLMEGGLRRRRRG